MSAGTKQMLAVVAGGVAGAACASSACRCCSTGACSIRASALTSHRTDIAVLVILWVQLVRGPDHAAVLVAARRRQRDADAWPTGRSASSRSGRSMPTALAALPWPFLFHMRARHDDLPAVPVQPAGARVERFRHARLSCSARTRWCAAARLNVPAGPQPAAPAPRRLSRAATARYRASDRQRT